ncbi:ATPase inhibitor, mitochondrial-like [Styela clava]|uniref:ATPase inhibitor, mitochondrial-like n=1 Tax=Styela clava TaxID=7725 RepID=UPI00193A5F79|nr:ATPase inhibitor, mitochondrial-like [Styela clava]
MASVIRIVAARKFAPMCFVRAMSGEGHIREAGGKFAEREQAEENRYFRRVQAQQLKELRDHHDDEIEQAEAEIKRLREKVERHKGSLKKLEKH